MSKQGMLWTAEEIEVLKKGVNEGKTLDELVALIDRTPYGIIGKMQTLGWIILVGSAYHLVHPDPWTMLPFVKAAQESYKEQNK